MATATPHLSLTLMGIGENVGTWGIPLNSNFTKLDIMAGEVINARGSFSNVSGRFGSIETEISNARGSLPTLAQRLGVLLLQDGQVNIDNFPKATQSALGVVTLSVPQAIASQPIAIGNNDPRILTQNEHDQLVLGQVTTIHKHNLAQIADVLVSASNLNQALNGINGTVTAANLNVLTGGGIVPKSLMTVPNAAYNYTGIVSLSSTPADATKPVAVGDNDTRMLTQTEKDQLVSGSNTSLHKHVLADGASDLTVTATVLNRLTGAGSNVTASNLDTLTGGNNTVLHHHDSRYYTKSESDTSSAADRAHSNTILSNHDANSSAHAGQNLSLGNTTVATLQANGAGQNTVRSHSSDATGAIKFEVKDKSGATKFSVNTEGVVIADTIQTRVHNVVETTTMSQAVIATTDLTVNGNTVLGNSTTNDYLTVNAANSTFSGPITCTSPTGITSTKYNGIDLPVWKTSIDAVASEVVTARGGKASVGARITDAENAALATNAEVVAARGAAANVNARLAAIEAAATTYGARNDNPNQVSLAQVIAKEGVAAITVAKLTTLTNGSDADATHTHAKYDTEIAAAKVSTAYGTFATIDARLENSEGILNALNGEVVAARNGQANLDTRLDASDTVVAGHEGRLIAVEGGLVTANGNITSVTTTANNVSAEVVNARSTFGNVGARFADIESKVSANASAIASLNGTSTTLTGKVTTLENSMIDRTTRVAALETWKGTADTDIINLKTWKTTVDGTNAAQDTSISTLNTNVGTLTTTVAGLPRKFTNNYASATSFTVTHNLGNKAVIVQVYDQANDQQLLTGITSITTTDNNTVNIVIATAKAVRVVVIG